MANPTGKGGWQPGQSGNPNGRPPKGETLADAIRAELEALGRGSVPKKVRVARKAVSMAVAGDIAAMRFVADRVDGKVPQIIRHAGAEGAEPVRIVVTKETDVP